MKTILEYFEQTEKKYAHCTAVEDMDGTMTWAQLGRLSRQLGTAFARQGERGKPVVILAEKSRTVLAAMQGTFMLWQIPSSLRPGLRRFLEFWSRNW